MQLTRQERRIPIDGFAKGECLLTGDFRRYGNAAARAVYRCFEIRRGQD
jgi:hypothetical protein